MQRNPNNQDHHFPVAISTDSYLGRSIIIRANSNSSTGPYGPTAIWDQIGTGSWREKEFIKNNAGRN